MHGQQNIKTALLSCCYKVRWL